MGYKTEDVERHLEIGSRPRLLCCRGRTRKQLIDDFDDHANAIYNHHVTDICRGTDLANARVPARAGTTTTTLFQVLAAAATTCLINDAKDRGMTIKKLMRVPLQRDEVKNHKRATSMSKAEGKKVCR